MRSLRLLPAVLLTLGLFTGASADDPQKPADTPHFSSTAQLITVPVIVTRSGEHVTGLKKEDFVVTQDGVAQTIANFDEVTTQAPVLPPASAAPKPMAYEFSNIGPSHPTRFTIIVIDVATTDFGDQTHVRAGVLKYLKNNINAREPIALFATTRWGIRPIHDFSTDPTILVAAIDQVWSSLNQRDAPPPSIGPPESTTRTEVGAGRPGDMLAEEVRVMQALFHNNAAALDQAFNEGFALDTIAKIQAMARAYAGIPGRKSLIWISANVPFPPTSTNPAVAMRGAETILLLNSANMAVYPLDAEGLVPPSVDNMAQSPQQRNQTTHTRGEEAMVNASLAASRNLPDTIRTKETDFGWIADATGGRAILRNNDIAGSVARAMDDSTQFYQLSYYLKTGVTPGWHKIAVKVNQPHLNVRTRTGVLIDSPGGRHDIQSDVAQALGSPMELTAVPMVATWLGQGGNSGEPKTVGFELSILPRGVMVDDADGNHINLSVIAIARNGQGKVMGQVARTIENRLSAEGVQKFAKAGLNFNSALSMEPGRYSVKFLVRDNISGRVGTVTAPLVVN